MSSPKAQAIQAAKLAARKADLRAKMKAIRAECAATVTVGEAAFDYLLRILDAFLPLLHEPDAWAATYLSHGDEFPTDVLNNLLRAKGIRLCVPCWDETSRTYRWAALTEPLIPGPHGIPQPATLTPVDPKHIHVAFVPGLAFDRDGNRLGHGAGVYDRLLAQPYAFTVIGLCYNRQIRGKVPAGAHDVPVDLIVSERVTLLTEITRTAHKKA